MIRFLPFALLAAGAATAQNLIVNDAPAALFFETHGVSAMIPAAGPPALNVYPHAPPLPCGPPIGAVTLNTTNGETWYTDGVTLAVTNHNAYALAPLPVPPVFPAPPMPAGPIHGMALDPLANVLWITDGVTMAAAVLAPPPVVWVVPPMPPAFQPNMPPLTGLEWDSQTGTLWVCDAGGWVYNVLAGPPFPIVGPVLPPGPLPPPIVGVTIDKSVPGIPGGPPPTVYVAGGGMIADYTTGIVFPSGAGGGEVGLTFHPIPASMPPGVPGGPISGICPCPALPAMGLRLLGPMTTGNPAFGVDLIGLNPNQLVIMGFDFSGFNPAFPWVNTFGCGLGLTLASFGVPMNANAAGVASLPIPLIMAPVGASLYMQYVTPCPGDALGVVLTPVFQVVVSAP